MGFYSQSERSVSIIFLVFKIAPYLHQTLFSLSFLVEGKAKPDEIDMLWVSIFSIIEAILEFNSPAEIVTI